MALDLVLDFRHPDASALLLELVQHYDVLVEGFRPGVLDTIGLSPQRLHRQNPGLIVARISGYGQHGEWAQVPWSRHQLRFVSGLLASSSLTDRGPALPRHRSLTSLVPTLQRFRLQQRFYARTR